MKWLERFYPVLEEAGDDNGGGGSHADDDPTSDDPSDKEDEGGDRPLENTVREMTRKLGNVTDALEKANAKIAELEGNKNDSPAVPKEKLDLLDRLSSAFGKDDGEPDDPLAKLGPRPDPYVDGWDKYEEWSEQRNQILIDRKVQETLKSSEDTRAIREGTSGYADANNSAESGFVREFERRTNRKMTNDELDELATFTNNNISPTGKVYHTDKGPRRAYTDEDIWKAYKLKNHDTIVSGVASKAQSEAARALRDVSDVSTVGSGPTDASDFESMSAEDQAVTLKSLEREGRFEDAKTLINDMRRKSPSRLRQVRAIIENAEAAAKDETIGGEFYHRQTR